MKIRDRQLPWHCPFLLVLLVASTGCQSSSNFFRVRNPFQEEAKAVGEFLSKPQNQPEPARETGIDSGPADRGSEGVRPERPELPERPENLYFGQRSSSLQLPSKKQEPNERRWFGQNKKPPKNPTVGEFPAAPMPDERGPATAAAADQTRPARSGAPTDGQPCYRCNGKGYYLSSLGDGGELVDCASCGGTGRR